MHTIKSYTTIHNVAPYSYGGKYYSPPVLDKEYMRNQKGKGVPPFLVADNAEMKGEEPIQMKELESVPGLMDWVGKHRCTEDLKDVVRDLIPEMLSDALGNKELKVGGKLCSLNIEGILKNDSETAYDVQFVVETGKRPDIPWDVIWGGILSAVAERVLRTEDLTSVLSGDCSCSGCVATLKQLDAALESMRLLCNRVRKAAVAADSSNKTTCIH